MGDIPQTGYRTQSPDTSLDAERILIEAYRRVPSWEKVRRVSEMARACAEFARAGIRSRHPAATKREVGLCLAALRFSR